MVMCFAYGCSNTEASGKALFTFPKDPIILKQWVSAINRNKHDFERTKAPRLCEDHFDVSSFNKQPVIARQLNCRLRLVVGAVPARHLFKRKITDDENDNTENKKRRTSLAYEKRQNLELIATSNQIIMPDIEGSSASTDNPDCATPSLAVNMATDTPDSVSTNSIATQTSSLKTCSKYLQTNTLVTKNKSTQYYASVSSKSCQTDEQQENHKITCEAQTQTQICKNPLLNVLKSPTLRNESPRNISMKPNSDNESSESSDDSLTDDSESEDDDDDSQCNDPDYEPPSDTDEDSEEYDSDQDCEEMNEELQTDCPIQQERKFIVFQSCLLSILSLCLVCKAPCKVFLKYIMGSMAAFEQVCVNGHNRIWATQPKSGKMPQGNLQLAAGILFSGCSPAKAIMFLKHINVLTVCYRTFNMIQRSYLLPAIFHVWKTEQDQILNKLRISSEKITLGGDARCDSPGHCAKYGSYSLMDLNENKIIAIELVQVNEVSNSNAMELEGLKRGFSELDRYGITVDSLTTDRHPQVQKYMRISRSLVKHFYDCWHIAKSIYKKVLALAKKAGYTVLKEWAHSISNHLYWCASSSNGDSNLVREKWQSMNNHIADIHTGHGDLFPNCLHPTIEREWLVKESRAHKGLKLIINSNRLLKDIGKMSPGEQTSALESYHKVVCLFAPKFAHFFYSSMRGRLFLSGLHFNENSSRAQAKDQSGKARWSVTYPKYKECAILKEVKVKCTYEYVVKLNAEVQRLRCQYPTYCAAKVLVEQYQHKLPPPLSSNKEKQDKTLLVQNFRTRFPHKK